MIPKCMKNKIHNKDTYFMRKYQRQLHILVLSKLGFLYYC